MSAQAPTPRAAAPDVPENVGKLLIRREIGRGTASIVYLAHDPAASREVAVKVYNLDSGENQEQAQLLRNMFLSEARLVGMLQHPYILPIYDAGEEAGRCYIVTEHVPDARTLAECCKPGSLLPIEAVVEVMFKCAKALHYAHASGVIHRDIKPSNILLTQERDVRLIDFGLALVAGSQAPRIEGIAGSPSYMSAEQVQQQPLSNRSDLYSLGAVMYELLTGARPFKASHLERLMHQIIYATPPPIHTLNPEVPEEIENVVAIALQKDPDKRYRSGLDFAAELTRAYPRLRGASGRIDGKVQLDSLRKLPFFQGFSEVEIREVLRAGSWRSCAADEELVAESSLQGADPQRRQRAERFCVVVEGRCALLRGGERLGSLDRGDCFGEAAYLPSLLRRTTVRALGPVTLLEVSPRALEQAPQALKDKFNRVFLRTALARVRGSALPPDAAGPDRLSTRR